MSRPREKNKHLPKYVTVINGAYWYRGPKDANGVKPKPLRLAGVGEEHVMYSEYAKVLQPVSNSPVRTMGDLFDRYEREIVPQFAPRTQKDYRWILKQLRKVFGNVPPQDIQPRDIGSFLYVDKGKQSRNRMVSVMSAVFQKAVGRWYLIDRNPCVGVDRNESAKRTRYVTDDEYKAVYNLASPRIQIAMDLALLTGQRQGDLLGLTWDQVLEDGILFFPGKTARKTGKRILVEYSDALREVLVRARQMSPQVPRRYVIRTREGKRYTSEGFKAMWIRTMDRAIGKKKSTSRKEIAPVITQRFTFHDLRAKSVSDTADIQKAFERACHTSMAMTRGVYDRGIRKVTPLR